jgi:hypothetical protein
MFVARLDVDWECLLHSNYNLQCCQKKIRLDEKSLLFLILVIISCNSFNQKHFGEIRNIKNNLPISGANIYFIKDSIKDWYFN